jgi:hypothetical protein
VHARIDSGLELQDVFSVAGFGEVELADELDEEGVPGPMYLQKAGGRPGMAPKSQRLPAPPGGEGKCTLTVSRRLRSIFSLPWDSSIAT